MKSCVVFLLPHGLSSEKRDAHDRPRRSRCSESKQRSTRQHVRSGRRRSNGHTAKRLTADTEERLNKEYLGDVREEDTKSCMGLRTQAERVRRHLHTSCL